MDISQREYFGKQLRDYFSDDYKMIKGRSYSAVIAWNDRFCELNKVDIISQKCSRE